MWYDTENKTREQRELTNLEIYFYCSFGRVHEQGYDIFWRVSLLSQVSLWPFWILAALAVTTKVSNSENVCCENLTSRPSGWELSPRAYRHAFRPAHLHYFVYCFHVGVIEMELNLGWLVTEGLVSHWVVYQQDETIDSDDLLKQVSTCMWFYVYHKYDRMTKVRVTWDMLG